MNIAMIENPFKNVGVIVSSRGVMTDAKAAKLNNDTKRPAIVSNWEKGLEKTNSVSNEMVSDEHKLDSILGRLDAEGIDYYTNCELSSARKLKVSPIIIDKGIKFYGIKVGITLKEESVNEIQPAIRNEEVETAKENSDLINQINELSMPTDTEITREDAHGRHERALEKEVNDIKTPVAINDSGISSRMEKNAMEHENASRQDEMKQETKAGDIDLYNNLLHSSREDDVSRQLQGAREELSIQKEESRKLAEQYSRAINEYERLRKDLEDKKRIKEQQEKRELDETLNKLDNLKRQNLERTSDLSSIQAEIAKLKAQKEAMESSMYESRSLTA